MRYAYHFEVDAESVGIAAESREGVTAMETRLMKLPKWAQERIKLAEMRLAESEEELAESEERIAILAVHSPRETLRGALTDRSWPGKTIVVGGTYLRAGPEGGPSTYSEYKALVALVVGSWTRPSPTPQVCSHGLDSAGSSGIGDSCHECEEVMADYAHLMAGRKESRRLRAEGRNAGRKYLSKSA